MDQETIGWLVVHSGLDQEEKQKEKEKEKKEKGAMCGFLCFIQGRRGLGAMKEFGESSPHGWEKDPGSYYLGRIWELGIQHCPTER